nr:O-antigen ligase family protein [Candidatus Calescibacterium sp.]
TTLLTLLGLFQGFGWISENVRIFGMSFRAMFMGGRLYATLQYPNAASAYLGMGYLALLGATFWEEKGERFRFLSSCLAFLSLSGAFFTYSRGGILVLGLILLVLLFILPQRMKAGLFLGIFATAFPFLAVLPFLERFLHGLKPLPFFGILAAGALISSSLRELLEPLEENMKQWPPRKFLLSVTVLFVAVGCVFLVAVASGFVGRGTTRLLDVSLRTRNVWDRLIFYRDGLKIFAQRPLNGWGGGGWEALYLSVRAFPYTTKSTHNFYLQVLIEGGVLGVALLALMLFVLFKSATEATSADPTPWSGTLLGILLLGFLHGFVDFDFNLGAYQLAVWFFAGCVIGRQTASPPQRPHRSLSIHPLALGVFCSLVFALALPPTITEWRGIAEYSLTEEKNWSALVAHLEKSAHLEPWNPELWFSLSQALRLQSSEDQNEATYRKAIEAAERALHLSPRNADIMGYLGILYAEAGEFEKALGFLKKATAEDPFRVSHYLNLAKVCHYGARKALAQGEKEKALSFLKAGLSVEELLRKAEEKSLLPLEWDTKEVREILKAMEKLKEQIEGG